MNNFLFDSQCLESLQVELSAQLELDGVSLFAPATIVISHPAVKEWLQMEMCKRSEKKGIVGLEFVHWRKLIPHSLSIPEIAAAIWPEIGHIEECQPFLSTKEKAIDFVHHLSTLFAEYFDYGTTWTIQWQKELFEKVFPVIELVPPQEGPLLYLFAVDPIPSRALQYFLSYPNIRIFRFSPCAMFWEDFCSSSERKWLMKKAPVQKEALDSLLRDTQPLLANWGVAGRKNLKLYPEPTTENYDMEEGNTVLHRLKLEFLLAEQTGEMASDHSLRCLKTGSSRIQEMQVLREEILKLGIPFSEIRVYAPDIAPYAPLIEYCFQEIPYRIAGLDLVRQSDYYQVLFSLFKCVGGRWEAEELLSIFERPAFYRKAGWKSEAVEKIADWIRNAGIRHGFDSWKLGLNNLIDSWLFFQPEKELSIGWSDADLFQSFYESFERLQSRLRSWKNERTLSEWAIEIEQLAHEFLWMDSDSEPAQKIVTTTLDLLNNIESDELFPFAFVEKFFFASMKGEVGGSALHAIRFASLESGAMLPARAIFLIGMDEEKFPRPNAYSSLRQSDSISRADLDRYLFLQAVFAAKEQLIFSYSHKSSEDGKAVSPSLLIQELFGYLKNLREETPHLSIERELTPSLLSNSMGPTISTPKPVSIQELTRFLKNPFQYYLKQQLGIELEEEPESAWEEFEFSALDRHLSLKSFLDGEIREEKWPLGLFGKSSQYKIDQEKQRITAALKNWGVDPKEVALHLSSDNIGATLRRWPEILDTLIAHGGHRVYYLKTGRVREVADPKEALQRIIDLYWRSQKSPLFLHPEWADPLLRKETLPDTADERILKWALARSPHYDLSVEKKVWDAALHETFSPLVALYPTKVKNATV